MDTITTPQQLGAFAAMAWTWGVAFLPRLAAAVLIFVAGMAAADWSAKMLDGGMARTGRIDPTVRPVISSAVRYSVLILVLVAALGQLGIQTASILAALGAAGLAVGLALQGTLSNIAAGLMLLWLRPFRAGDYIETATLAGTIRDLGLFATEIDTFDGVYRFVPNSEIWNKPLLNHTRNPSRMLSLTIGVSASGDPEKAREILAGLFRGHSGVLGDPPAEIFIDAIEAGSVLIVCRAWIASRGFWMTARQLIEEARRNLSSAGLSPERILHLGQDVGSL